MYRKFSADALFTGTEMLQDRVLITDETGRVANIVATSDAGDDIQYNKGILSPGFVNCHCHLELSHMRGRIPEKTGLIDFVFSVMTQRHFAEEEILEAISNAEATMIANGIVGVGDICNNSYTIAQKKKGNLRYYNFVEVSGWLPQLAGTRMSQAVATYQAFCNLTPGDKRYTSVVPHAPYSVSDDLWQLLPPYFNHKTVSIHNQETSFEDELFLQGSGSFNRMYQQMNLDTSFFKPSGKSSLQTYFSRLGEAASVMLVHNTFITPNDIAYASAVADKQGQDLYFCLCPNANLFIEDTLPPVHLLLQHQCTLVLGTDSLASNYTLSIVDEMRTLKQHVAGIPMTQLLRIATLNGAHALNLQHILGSFEKGKQPGVVLLSEALDNVQRLL